VGFTLEEPQSKVTKQLGGYVEISWSMSLPRKIGVGRSQRWNRGSMRKSTSNGSIVYLTLCSESLRLLLSTQLMSLLTKRLLLSSSGPESFPTHSRSLTTSGAEWIVLCRILMCLHILSLSALWRAFGQSI